MESYKECMAICSQSLFRGMAAQRPGVSTPMTKLIKGISCLVGNLRDTYRKKQAKATKLISCFGIKVFLFQAFYIMIFRDIVY